MYVNVKATDHQV